jgi:hypothetical protein
MADDTTLNGQLSALFIDTAKYGTTEDAWWTYNPYDMTKPTNAKIEITTKDLKVFMVENSNLTP